MIAHANGRLTEVSLRNRERIQLWIKQDRRISEEHGCIMLSQAFVRQGYTDVEQEIVRLIAIAKAKDGISNRVRAEPQIARIAPKERDTGAREEVGINEVC